MAFGISFGGGSSKSKKEGEFERSGLRTEKLNLNQQAIEKIIADVLGAADGLAGIFAGEQTAGIFDSSVAAQASGDLVANIIGELSKLTAEKEVSETQRGTQREKGKGSELNFGVDLSFGD